MAPRITLPIKPHSIYLSRLLLTTTTTTTTSTSSTQSFRSCSHKSSPSAKPRTSGLSALRNKTATASKPPPRTSTTQTPSSSSSSPPPPPPPPPKRIFGQLQSQPIRTRFAPSPTGYLHLGSLRTALFCALSSSSSTSPSSSFILRIEDTDRSRLIPSAESHIIQDLQWLGLKWDEGPDIGGPHGPYRQSERLHIYHHHVNTLLDKGHAYRCFCRPEDLEQQKRLLHEAGEPTVYSGACRSIAKQDSNHRAANNEPYVVRFKGREFGQLSMRDAIYGPFQKKDPEEDFIILKSDGFPTYHLANVVDDHLMQITHVIRGEEWLISTPKHLALYQAFGWQPPTYAHLGLLINDDGSKLSKRQNSANLSTYRQNGTSPMAMQIWLANLGSSLSSSSRGAGTAPPRNLSDLADRLTFKFTRGGIKLNPEKLANIELAHRKAIMTCPHSDPETNRSEEKWFLDNIYHPLTQQIQEFSSPHQLPSWQEQEATTTQSDTLDIIPHLLSSPSKIRDIYAYALTASSSSSASSIFTSPPQDSTRHIILSHPYLFWRIPPSLYTSSLSTLSTPTLRQYHQIFSAFQTLCRDPSLWESPQTSLNTALLDALSDSPEPIPSQLIYHAHRLLATGTPDRPSASLGVLSKLLGMQECAYRVGVVKKMVEELLD